ncbi:MAG: GHKL domain-containing protein [Clostridium butyricum]|jgi:two-component system sensor histidine kinase AgrC|nr:GHKL domain-containing protein [Clostridium butyricum]
MNVCIAALGASIILFLSMINLSYIKFSFKEFILIIVLNQCLNINIILLNLSEFAVIISIFFTLSMYICIKSKNVLAGIIIPISTIIIYVVIDYTITNISILLFSIGPESVRENNELYCFIYVLEFFIMFIISRMLGYTLNRKTKMLDKNFYINKRFNILLIISFLLTIITVYTNIILEHKSNFRIEFIKINGMLFLFYSILLMIITYILIINITKEINLKNKQIQFENLQQYTNSLEDLYTDMRGFRHDYINIISSLMGYIENKDMDGLERYFNKRILCLSEGIEANNLKIGNLKNIKVTEIKGILSSKLIRAQELEIDTFIDIVEPIEKINMDIIDLSRIVGILLDNAVEGAVECDKPSLKVGIINKENSILIVIINSVKDKIPIYKIYEKDFSTKGENRGLGLYSLKEITNKYNNVFLDTVLENNEFKQLLQIGKDK